MTAAEQRAIEAWSKVVRKRSIFDHFSGSSPMPPLIAVDYVQDEVGQREEAVLLLFAAAAEWLREKVPVMAYHRHSSLGFMLELAASICGALEMGWVRWTPLMSMRDIINEHIGPHTDYLMQVDNWRVWTVTADRVLNLCEKIREGLPDGQAEA